MLAALILESNAAFGELLAIERDALRRLDELPNYFADPDQARRKAKGADRSEPSLARRSGRGKCAGRTKTVLVRADPVFAAPGRVLGFVLLFADLTDRKAAESARRRFQDGIVLSHRKVSGVGDAPADAAVRI